MLGLPEFLLTGAGLPIPEEVPVLVAGAASYHGTFNPWIALATCLVAALAGDCLLYGIGHHFGHNVFRRWPWFARVINPEREAQLELLLKQHGIKVFFVARFLVGIRAPVYLAAGILRVPFKRFLLVDMFNATAVIGFFFGLGFLFAPHLESWWHTIRRLEYSVTVLVVVAVVIALCYYWRRHSGKKKESHSAAAPPASPSPDSVETRTYSDS